MKKPASSRLSNLPRAQTWLGSRRRCRARLPGPGKDAVLWVEAQSGVVRTSELVAQDSDPEALARGLDQAILEPREGEPALPERVVVDCEEEAARLRRQFSSLDINVSVRPSLGTLEQVFDRVDQVAGRDPGPSFLDHPLVKPRMVARLLDRVQRFWDLSPWHSLSQMDVLEIEGLQPSPLWCSVVERGLVVYLSPAALPGQGSEGPTGPDPVLVLSAGDPAELGVRLLTEYAVHRWALPANGDFPVLSRSEGSPAGPGEVALVARVVEAVTSFLLDASDRERVPVELQSGGEVQIGLAADNPSDHRSGVEGLHLMAMALVQQATRGRSREKKRQLALEALSLWPDCFPAWQLLAESCDSPEEALPYRRQAYRLAEQQLGVEFFQPGPSRLWDHDDGRLCMATRLELMKALASSGRLLEAVEHAWGLLQFEPEDPVGVRFLLGGYLLRLRDQSGLERLLSLYRQDHSAMWLYTWALHEFRRSGDTSRARRRLQRALQANRHVPEQLLNNRRSRRFPQTLSPGGPEEARFYRWMSLDGWRSTPGALEWLRRHRNDGMKAVAHQSAG